MPPRVILAPIDFSEPSRTALVFAARLARQTHAALHVMFAEDPLLAKAARHARFDLARDTEEEFGRFLSGAWPAAELTPQHHVATGPAVDVILDVAQRVGADLVVVGSHGMSGAERLVFGSTTEGLLRRAPVSVLVMPAKWSPLRSDVPDLSGAGPVIAAIDFSPSSVAVAQAACQLASAIGTTIEMVHVVPELSVIARWRAHAEVAVRDRVASAGKALEKLVQAVGCGVPVEPRVDTGDVPNRLADAAASAGARRPILVLGRRPPGPSGAAPGSTAYRVLLLARVPTLMHIADT